MQEQNDTTFKVNKKSRFITVVSWIFILFFAFGSFVSIINITVLSKTPMMIEYNAQIEKMAQDAEIFSFTRFYLSNIQTFTYLTCIFNIIVFFSAIGLLKRKEWARSAFIIILITSILLSLVGLAIQPEIYDATASLNQANSDPNIDAEALTESLKTATMFMTLFFCGLYTWMITKLRSEEIMAEFE